MKTKISMEEIIKEYGFESQAEFSELINNVDLSSPEKVEAFRKWQIEDGTKENLLKIIKNG